MLGNALARARSGKKKKKKIVVFLIIMIDFFFSKKLPIEFEHYCLLVCICNCYDFNNRLRFFFKYTFVIAISEFTEKFGGDGKFY